MKAITIWQPYASLVSIHKKPDETRGWPTKYRGPIAIHAGVKPAHEMDLETIRACHNAFGLATESLFPEYVRGLPHGSIVAIAKLVECWKVIEHTQTAIILMQSNGVGEDKVSIHEPYLAFGDYSVGRYIWGLADIHALPEPIPAKGKQGLWNWEPPEGVSL